MIDKTDLMFLLILGPLVLSVCIFIFVLISKIDYTQETKRIAAENCVFVERKL